MTFRITAHVHHYERPGVRYRLCAKTETLAWIRLVGPPDAELERVPIAHLRAIPPKDKET